MILSVVTPVYKEEENIESFLSRTVPVVSGISDNYEIIFVLDPSPDATEQIIVKASELNPKIKLVKNK